MLAAVLLLVAVAFLAGAFFAAVLVAVFLAGAFLAAAVFSVLVVVEVFALALVAGLLAVVFGAASLTGPEVPDQGSEVSEVVRSDDESGRIESWQR